MSTCRLISSGWLPLAPLWPGSSATTAPSSEPGPRTGGGGVGGGAGAGSTVVVVEVVVVDVEVVGVVSAGAGAGLDGVPLAASFGGAPSPHAPARTRQHTA